MDKVAHGWSSEEVHFQHSRLSLAQIHASLAYYYDHQVEVDSEIERRRQEALAVACKASDPDFRKKQLELRRQR
ncbi:MAG TPA: hypothetical protein VLZ81_17590 [Blastocatellia bacterium]|nr:hypothetical protein [Blastocatellia bacterium]